MTRIIDLPPAVTVTANDFVPLFQQGVTKKVSATILSGPPGPAATVSVGSTTTGNPGTSAAVTNSGNTSNAVLNFTIPRGADGLPGAASRYYSQDTPPSDSRLIGDIWFDTSVAVRYEWVIDIDGGQWVDMTGFSAGPNLTTNDIEITDFTKGIILRSPDNSRWRVTIDNAGVLLRTKL